MSRATHHFLYSSIIAFGLILGPVFSFSFWVGYADPYPSSNYSLVRDANKKNRLSPTLTFPEMLPHSVVNAISVQARSEQEAEERREMRVEALPDWLEVYQLAGAAVYRTLRRILPDRMIPSMYQIDHNKETLAQKYGPATA